MLSLNDKINDLEIIAELGCDSLARRYLARRRGVGRFSRLVMLKVVHRHLCQDEYVIKQFLHEARACAYLTHPNVLQVEDVGRYRGSYFVALEYVHGVSLATLLVRLAERGLRPQRKLCVWLVAQIAEALDAAHEATGGHGRRLDVVHGELSPRSVLIAHTGHVKVIDFGGAHRHVRSDHGSGARLLGGLRYRSPEQLQLERFDRRADVYALGVILWELLAGRSLFTCQRLDDERDWATRDNPPAPSKHSPPLSPALDRAALKAIAFRARERFSSARIFRAALLRAEPAATRVDAPMVAALVRSTIGEELERERANWPSDAAEELEPTTAITMSRGRIIEELTVSNVKLAPLHAERAGIDDADDEVRDTQEHATRTRPRSQRSRSADGEGSPRVDGPLGNVEPPQRPASQRAARLRARAERLMFALLCIALVVLLSPAPLAENESRLPPMRSAPEVYSECLPFAPRTDIESAAASPEVESSRRGTANQ